MKLCVDDTWQDENGAWTANSMLAIPYLLKENWHILEQKDNAVLIEEI